MFVVRFRQVRDEARVPVEGDACQVDAFFRVRSGHNGGNIARAGQFYSLPREADASRTTTGVNTAELSVLIVIICDSHEWHRRKVGECNLVAPYLDKLLKLFGIQLGM